MIRCVVIDDEPLALHLLSRFIERIPDLELVGTFLSPSQASETLAKEKVDLLFLDIDMPEINGIDFAKSLGAGLPYVVFTTAFPQYAVEGFIVNAVDYLLKPISFARLKESVARATVRMRAEVTKDATPVELGYIYVKTGGSVRKVNFNDIIYVKGMGEYIQIKINGEKVPLTTLESI